MSFATGVLAFCATLRNEHGFTIGHFQAHEALRAVETIGVGDPARVRCALRLVCCGRYEEIALFDRAFDAFFLAPRHGLRRRSDVPRGVEAGASAARRLDAAPPAATSWETLRARYSPAAGRSEPPPIPAEGLAEMLAAASRLVSDVRLGRSRRWRPQERGERFDLRRTLRRSLHTGGDPVSLRRLGHPPRNPRFVVLVDGSRSMAEHGALMLQFAYALAARCRRTSVFLFSTELREATRELREPPRRGERRLAGLGEAWGGGTRIGANLFALARGSGRRQLGNGAVAIVISDGLEVGDAGQIERAMREIRRRSAAVVWIHPLAGTPGFAPLAAGLRAALPYVTTFVSARNAREFGTLMRRSRA